MDEAEAGGVLLWVSDVWFGFAMSAEIPRRQGTVEEIGEVQLEAGKPIEIMVEYTNTRPPEGPESDRSQPALMRGLVCSTRSYP